MNESIETWVYLINWWISFIKKALSMKIIMTHEKINDSIET